MSFLSMAVGMYVSMIVLILVLVVIAPFGALVMLPLLWATGAITIMALLDRRSA